MIPQRNLSLISNALLTQGGRRIPEAVIERDYVLAWFLVGLAGHPLREVLAFKGGTALRRCWFAHYRFSEDLDFTLTRPISWDSIRAALEEIFAAVREASGIAMAFDRLDRHQHSNSHTFYLRYQGPLPAPNDVKVDITIRETLEFPLRARSILRTYSEFEDLPAEAIPVGDFPDGLAEAPTVEAPTVLVYAVEEIVVEKILALSDRARSEARDLYDLWYLLEQTGVHIPELRAQIEAKLLFRGRSAEGLEEAIAAKAARLKTLWTGRLSHQMNHLPEYEGVFRAVLRAVRGVEFPPAPVKAALVKPAPAKKESKKPKGRK